MSTLLQALTDGSYDLVDKRVVTSNFAAKVTKYRDEVINDYFKHGINLNKAIAKLATRDNFNDDQIQRILEEVNNQVFLIKYNQIKDHTSRNVEFDLASLQGIKHEQGVKDSRNESVHTQVDDSNKPAGDMKKQASWEDDFVNSKELDSFNTLKYSSTGFGAKQTDKKYFELRKIASDIRSEEQHLKRGLFKLANTIDTISCAMVEYEKHNCDSQSIFSAMCKEASLNDMLQGIVIKGVENQLESSYGLGRLPRDFSFSIEKVATEKELDKYSLGEYSMISKVAHVTESNKNVPGIVANGVKINGADGLVKIASELIKSASEVGLMQSKLKSLYKSVDNKSLFQLEKEIATGFNN